MWSDFAVSGQRQNIPKFKHILGVFSGQADRIALIPFALCQVFRDTRLEYPQHVIWRTLNFHLWGTYPTLGDHQKYFSAKSKFS
jgi:hypothetical protein